MKTLKFFILFILSSLLISGYSQTISIDNSFGINGYTIIPNTTEISFFDFDKYGNIIAVGYTLKGGGKYDLTITKTDANGTLITSFGNNGVVKVTDYDQSLPNGLKITNDNKILILMNCAEIQFQPYQYILMQFNEDGTPDINFAPNGKIIININWVPSFITLENEFILIGKFDYQNFITNVSKFDYGGILDPSFGVGGIVTLTVGQSFMPFCSKLLNNSSIIVAGAGGFDPSIGKELAICKLTQNGDIDKSFATNGIWHLNIFQDFDLSFELFNNVFEESNGNLVFIGGYNDNGMFMSRFFADGTLDNSFGVDGFYYPIDNSISCGGLPILQNGNKYIIGGYTSENSKILCINNDGTINNNFGNNGVFTLENNFIFHDIKIQANDTIVVGGVVNPYPNGVFGLSRLIIEPEPISASINILDNFTIYPNPVKDNLNFTEETQVEITDIQGRVLLRTTKAVKSVNISSLQAGIYFVKVTLSNQNSEIIKIVKL